MTNLASMVSILARISTHCWPAEPSLVLGSALMLLSEMFRLTMLTSCKMNHTCQSKQIPYWLPCVLVARDLEVHSGQPATEFWNNRRPEAGMSFSTPRLRYTSACKSNDVKVRDTDGTQS